MVNFKIPETRMSKYVATSLSQPTNLRAAIASGQILRGTATSGDNPALARFMAHSGFDWVFIDAEHNSCDMGKLTEVIEAFQWHSFGTCVPVVRVPQWHTHEWIQWTLDSGAGGIIFPQVDTKADVLGIVEKVKYAPVGRRSKAPFRLVPGVTDTVGPQGQSVLQWSNEAVAIIIQIETVQAVENIEEICSVPEVDVIWIGTLDLRIAMGFGGAAAGGDGDEPEFNATMDKIIKCAHKHNKKLGGFLFPPAIEKRLNQGFTFAGIAADVYGVLFGCAQAKQGFNGVVEAFEESKSNGTSDKH